MLGLRLTEIQSFSEQRGNEMGVGKKGTDDEHQEKFGHVSQHDHAWWGPAGRPLERGGVIGHDGQGSSEEGSEEPSVKTTGTHGDDWREK